jgi:simple sugar transport system permease protein
MSRLIPVRHVPIVAAAAVLLVMITFGAARYTGFASPGNLLNLLGDNTVVGVAAVGATFVILSGGIDLSAGSLVAFSSVMVAWLVGHGWHPLAAMAAAVASGAALGAVMGTIIQAFELPAFMVTLAGMFGVRAAGFMISGQSAGIQHPFYDWARAAAAINLGGGATLPLRSMILMAVAAFGLIVARWTRFGRNIYAIGGSERSARAMGVPIAATRIGAYTVAGTTSALAGVVLTLYAQSGDPASSVGLELSVIAAVVIGGTLLAGGAGSVLGTMIGVLILGLIGMIIDFQGNLNAAWTSVAIGLLLLAFVGLQNLVAAAGVRVGRGRAPDG